METAKYNGWKNRSTWLVQVHLDNTNAEIAKSAMHIARNAAGTDEYKEYVLKLLKKTQIATEQEYDAKKVDWLELLNTNNLDCSVDDTIEHLCIGVNCKQA